ncbi:dimethylallyl tryptophan synthase FgaPT2 [Aspergillus unguis]
MAISNAIEVDADIYEILSMALGFPNQDQELWWHSTAPMFARMLQSGRYSIHEQCKHLIEYKKYIIPWLGVYPRNDSPRWLSILTRYGTPFELSLNCSDSLVRYTFEPINAETGTSKDPFNTKAIWGSLAQLRPIAKGMDLEWFMHFKEDLTLNDEESNFLLKNNLAGDRIRTQNKLALDLKNDGVMLKTYIYPALKALVTGKSIEELMFTSANRLAQQYPGIAKPVSVLHEYVRERAKDGTASPRLLSCDLVEPSKARLKIYLLEQMVSLPALENLWTLGGRRTSAADMAGLDLVRELWHLLRLPPGLQEYPAGFLPLGAIPDEQLPLMANYTIGPNDPMPQPQVYFTTFGLNDMAIADALVEFFTRRGWHDMARSYKRSLCSYYPNADHDSLNYLHAYISFSYQKNRPYLSVYLQSFETGNWECVSDILTRKGCSARAAGGYGYYRRKIYPDSKV